MSHRTQSWIVALVPARAFALLVCLSAAALTGCEQGVQEQDGIYKAEVGRVPAAPQRAGDAEAGRHALLNKSAVTCGVPYRVYRQTLATDAMTPQPRLVGRLGRNAELPYPLTAVTAASGVEIVTSNCLGCHAAVLDDEVIIGLGNEFLDMTRDPLIAVEATAAIEMSAAERAEWRRWSDRITAIADYMMTDTVGVNSANNITLALMAHLDPQTLAWSKQPRIEPPPENPLPLSVPPLWNLGKKHAVFYNAEGRGDHVRYMILAATACTDAVEEAAEIDAWFVDVRAYLTSLEPPTYPYDIDAGLARQGRGVFLKTCKECHGVYEGDERYPNRVVALGKVETDPLLARRGFSEADRFLKWFQDSFYGEFSQAAPALGYIAPPLDGVWATAPYLHNASVPTLEALLDSRQRPTYWEFDREGTERPAYDQEGVGWTYRTLERGKAAAMSWSERNRIYDTTQPGYGNQGHGFGDALTREERAALLEYLKTL